MKSYLKILPLVFVFAGMFIMSCGPKKDPKTNDQPTDSIPKEIAELNAAIANDPDNADLYLKRSRVFLERDDVKKALSDINTAIDKDPDNAQNHITLGDIYFRMGKVQQTKEALKKAVSLEEKNTEPLLKLAELHFFFTEYALCFDYLNQAQNLDPSEPKVYFMRAMALKEQGDTARAVQNFQTTINLEPDHFDAFMQLGLLYSVKKNPLAEEYFMNALNVQPESTEAMYGLGMYYQEVDMLNEAIEIYTNILTIDNKDKRAHYNLGYIHLVYLQVYSEAVKHFTNALNVDPNYAEAYYNRGYSYELMGDVSNARMDYTSALKIRTNYPRAIQGLNRLDALESKIQ